MGFSHFDTQKGAAMLRLEAANFYAKFPRPEHYPGDIWINLSCYGSLSKKPVTGLILTPACDLSNHKVESLTYIPVVSVGQYFSTTAVLPQVYRRFLGLASSAGITADIWRDHRYELPMRHELDALDDAVSALSGDKRGGLQAGLEVLRAICGDELLVVPAKCLSDFFGTKQTREMLERIVRNSYSPDLHFLPADGLNHDYSAVPYNSVALFRYPLSVPLHVLDAATETPADSWSGYAQVLMQRFPSARSFAAARPLKLGSLEPRFFADLLTRYVSLMIRLGAPSFDSEGVDALLSNIP